MLRYYSCNHIVMMLEQLDTTVTGIVKLLLDVVHRRNSLQLQQHANDVGTTRQHNDSCCLTVACCSPQAKRAMTL